MDRNFIVAIALTAVIFIGYDAFVMGPKRAAYEAQQAEMEATGAQEDGIVTTDELVAPTQEAITLTREEALTRAPARLPVDTPELMGSINLRGLTFDDITLRNYHETVDDASPRITLLSPAATPYSQFIRSGVFLNGERDDQIVWQAEDDAVLTPETPVTLTRMSGEIEHRVTLSVDDKFMFGVEHTIVNGSGEDLTIQPYGATFQKGQPPDLRNFMILFEGPLAVTGEKLYDRKYKKLLKSGEVQANGIGGWAGITDKFWLGAVIPPQGQPVQVKLDVRPGALPLFGSSYRQDRSVLAAGEQVSFTAHVYAGAKTVEVLRDYEMPIDEGGLGIQRFDMAIDWGNFFFLTRPIFNTLHFFNGIFGNYGIAILFLTLVIKAILFPLANMSYRSMAGMRKVQPEMKALQERYKDDKQKLQQEMMGLYKKHKINPAAGCLPMLAQMPIFYALYKTLFVTIEMRHEPFLYIKDLSERDPTSIFNLFGLLPYDPTLVPVIGTFLGIGILPLIMAAGMYVQMKLNPPPADPMQAKIFGYMPLIFLFIFAPFAAGLVLYWAWNTILGVIQQYVIMKRAGVDVDLIGNIKQSLKLGRPAIANDNKSGK